MVRTLIISLLFYVWRLPAADTTPAGVQHVPQFDKVNQNIYRGGQPSSVGIEELGAMGIKRIINLRQSGEGVDAEERQARQLHISFVNVPMPELSAPTNEQIGQVLKLLNDGGDKPIFIHCRRGKDRTGTVIACYRIQHDGWTNQHALEEAREHGLSSFERGMRSFVLHFTAPDTLLPSLTSAYRPQPLLH